MKKIVTFLVVFLIIFSGTLVSFADVAEPDNTATSKENKSSVENAIGNISDDDINKTINKAGNTAMSVGQNILDQITMWALPFCAIAVVWGAVQYFVLGIRNLYKKRQGLLLMWGSMTLYVVTLFINLILTFMVGK